jgi:hypothetical protein
MADIGRTIKKNNKGRGVYATRLFRKGSIIEDAPVILVLDDEVKGSEIDRYTFEWLVNLSALALGHGSLYNHSYTPNAVYSPIRSRAIMRFRAYKTIRLGEEITINYNGDPDCKTPVSFDVKK